ANLEFKDPLADVLAESQALRRRGAELMVLVAHIGGACANRADPDDLTSCDMDSELFKLLQQLPDGELNVVVGGHTHQYVAQRVGSTAVIESGSYGRSFGWVESCVGTDSKVTTNIHPPQEICARVWNDTGCSGSPQFAP